MIKKNNWNPKPFFPILKMLFGSEWTINHLDVKRLGMNAELEQGYALKRTF